MSTNTPIKHARIPHLRLFLVAIALLSANCVGCMTLEQRVVALANEGKYTQALKELEDARVGKQIADGVPEEALKARASYSIALETKASSESAALVKEGKCRAAASQVREWLRHCPWSEAITKLLTEREAIVASLDAFERSWEEDGEAHSIEQCRSHLRSGRSLLDKMEDSPKACQSVEKARDTVLAHWNDVIATKSMSGQPEWLTVFGADVELLALSESSTSRLKELALITANLRWRDKSPRKASVIERDLQSISNASRLIHISVRESADPRESTIARQLRRVLNGWLADKCPPLLDASDERSEALEVAESLLESDELAFADSMKQSVGRLHLRRAKFYSGQSRASALSLLHGIRAEELGVSGDETDTVKRQALASISACTPIEARLSIDLEANTDPILVPLFHAGIFTLLTQKSHDFFRWQIVDAVHDDADVRILLSKVEWLVPSIDNLANVESTYLSHYQDVPNPRKSTLAQMIDSASWQLNYARNTYNSTVASHNIYPTQYSLMNVNLAYNIYLGKLNAYNFVVNEYNMTPATVSEPVYLPYAFKQGTMRQGWRFQGQLQIGEANVSINCQRVERDFVRFGSHFADVNESYRKDDRLDLNTKAEHVGGLLFNTLEQLSEKLRQPLLGLPTFPGDQFLHHEELAARWLWHPFGPDEEFGEELNLPNWIIATGKPLRMPERSITPVPIPIELPPQIVEKNTASSVTELAEKWTPLICEVISVAGNTQVASGSGALISKNGHILTCAHVLRGSATRIRFRQGSHSGEYATKPVFVNAKKDVAVILADGLQTDQWLPIRVTGKAQVGEAIVAIGNPAIATSEQAFNAVSEGTVSSTQTDDPANESIVVNVAVASGSSGGPVISKEGGDIVGIVLAVSAPRIDPGKIASSGYFCIAAPAAKFGEWIGITAVELSSKD